MPLGAPNNKGGRGVLWKGGSELEPAFTCLSANLFLHGRGPVDDNIDTQFVVDAVEYCCAEAVLDFTQAAIKNPVYCTSVIDIDIGFFHIGMLQASLPLCIGSSLFSCGKLQPYVRGGVIDFGQHLDAIQKLSPTKELARFLP
jgi:hypothetical protein